MGTPEAIIFDIYNTLLDNKTDEERGDTYIFLSLWLSYHDVRISPRNLRRLYLDLCHKEMSRSSETDADIEIGNVFANIMAEGGRHLPSSETVSELALLFRILTTNHLAPFPGIVAMLDALKGNVKLAIASNSQRLFTIPELRRFGLVDFFDTIVFSSDVRACKPNPKIFREVLRQLSIEPDRAVYVGDNPVADVCGAHGVGMKTIWINRGRQDAGQSGSSPDFEVDDETSLTELLSTILNLPPKISSVPSDRECRSFRRKV